MRQKIPECQLPYILSVGEQQDEIVTAEFTHDLTAYAAGIGEIGEFAVSASDYGDFGEFPVTSPDSGEKRGSFGADRAGIGGILNIASGIYLAGFRQQSRSHMKMGIRRIGGLHGSNGGIQKCSVIHMIIRVVLCRWFPLVLLQTVPLLHRIL